MDVQQQGLRGIGGCPRTAWRDPETHPQPLALGQPGCGQASGTPGLGDIPRGVQPPLVSPMVHLAWRAQREGVASQGEEIHWRIFKSPLWSFLSPVSKWERNTAEGSLNDAPSWRQLWERVRSAAPVCPAMCLACAQENSEVRCALFNTRSCGAPRPSDHPLGERTPTQESGSCGLSPLVAEDEDGLVEGSVCLRGAWRQRPEEVGQAGKQAPRAWPTLGP